MEIWFSLALASDSQREISFILLPKPSQKNEHHFLNTINYYVVKSAECLNISYQYRSYEVSLLSGTRIHTETIALSEEEKHYFLRSTPINLVNEELKNEANEIIQGEEDSVERARKIFNFIVKKYSYSRHTYERGVMSFRKNKKGDCGEFAGLFVSYCRSLGMPSRVMVGSSWSNGKTRAHVWSEFFVENIGWIPVDIGSAALLKNPLNSFSVLAKKAKYFGAIEGKRICFSVDTDRALTPFYIDQPSPDNFPVYVVGDRELAWGYESIDGTAPYMQPMYVKLHSKVKKLKNELVLGKWIVKESTLRQLFLTTKNIALLLWIF
ncbi:transglutaminase-like domain-containing protein [Solibacillus sp. FSL H8-0538]|uniref:transglutaminase-like domain-containing protein n=1 Tax=Solibacillus sp. FSL H8-0538 TaxID=2921400 RepID=UPI0030FCFC48